MTCALIYRPPNFKLSPPYPSFVKHCEWFLKSDRILISGDFNFPSNQISENTQFHSILVSFGLLQLVKQSTHEYGNILDFIIIRHEYESLTTPVRIVEGVSDHKGILFEIILSTSEISVKIEIRRFRDFRQLDENEERRKLRFVERTWRQSRLTVNREIYLNSDDETFEKKQQMIFASLLWQFLKRNLFEEKAKR
jgi:hypothetical protein